MKKTRICLGLLAFMLICLPAYFSASAHQPRMIENQDTINIEDPELSQAFYEVLVRKPQIYTIDSDKSFLLYVNVLVPKSSNPDERYGAKIYQGEGETKKLLEDLLPKDRKWELFHEEFANDDYYQGPVFEQNVPAGKYEIEVYGEDNLGRYVLAVGKNEKFGINSIPMMLTILPRLKTDFFEVSPLSLMAGRLGIILLAELAILILLSFLIWKLVRAILEKYFPKYGFEKNLNRIHRVLRLVLALTILIFAINYWSIILGIVSSFLFYEAASGWCGLFSFLKINTYKQKIVKVADKKKKKK